MVWTKKYFIGDNFEFDNLGTKTLPNPNFKDQKCNFCFNIKGKPSEGKTIYYFRAFICAFKTIKGM